MRPIPMTPDARTEIGDDIVEVHATELAGAERDESYALQVTRQNGHRIVTVVVAQASRAAAWSTIRTKPTKPAGARST